MKITSNKLVVSDTESIEWEDVDNLRLSNNQLCLVLSSGKTIKVKDVHPSTADQAFRVYEAYLKDHPEKRRYQGRPRKRLR